jgi:hypothetical protein
MRHCARAVQAQQLQLLFPRTGVAGIGPRHGRLAQPAATSLGSGFFLSGSTAKSRARQTERRRRAGGQPRSFGVATRARVATSFTLVRPQVWLRWYTVGTRSPHLARFQRPGRDQSNHAHSCAGLSSDHVPSHRFGLLPRARSTGAAPCHDPVTCLTTTRAVNRVWSRVAAARRQVASHL